MFKTATVKIHLFISIVITGIVFCCTSNVKAQAQFRGLESLFTTPRNYIVYRTPLPPVIDGNINDDVWQHAQWTEDFQDIEGPSKPQPTYPTKVKMMWDDSCLYIAAQMHEPNVWAYQTHHDDIVFHDNDFEIFINPNNTTHQYYEVEVNAINTIFDLFLNNPYRDFGQPMITWNAEGMRSAVKVQGTLNNPNDTDEGWTVEMAIPFRALSLGNHTFVPRDGMLWRINFSRVEWDTKVADGKYVKQKDATGRNKPEHNWVWSAQGLVDMHFPERWGYLQFSKTIMGHATFTMPYAEEQKRYLWLIYYREHLYHEKTGKYTPSLKQFGLDSNVMVNNRPNTLKIEATDHLFMGFITDDRYKTTYTIDQHGLVHLINNSTNE